MGTPKMYIMEGTPIDCVLYANNYEQVDEKHPVIEQFKTAEEALEVFRRGAVMSKGTTTSKGLVENYFANIFGPPQYRDLHETLAEKYFKLMFEKDVFVGQMRTMLGVAGSEKSGPQQSARALLKMIQTISEDA